jgi:alpha-ketoglutarate-dependent taurine dioxygenase
VIALGNTAMREPGYEGQLANVLQDVRRHGFAPFRLNALPVATFLNGLKRGGHLITQTILTVRDKGDPLTAKKTLSMVHGRGEFPFHTDYAFRPVPPKLIVLVNDSDLSFRRPTFLSSLADLPSSLMSLLQNARWLLQSRNGTFVISSIQPVYGMQLIRWDVDFLAPFNRSAHLSADHIPMHLASVRKEIVWEPGSAVVIDNWALAHARGATATDELVDEERTLVRYEVWNHA